MNFIDVLDEEETQYRAGRERRELPPWSFRARPSAFYVSGGKGAPQTYSDVSARQKVRLHSCAAFEGLLESVVGPQSLAFDEPIAESLRSVPDLLGHEWKFRLERFYGPRSFEELATAAAAEQEEPTLWCFDPYVIRMREVMSYAKLFLARETQGAEEVLDWDEATRRIEAERRAYEEQKEEILALYNGQYVAILNGAVIDSDSDCGVLAKRVYARIGRRPVLLTRATREPTVAVTRRGHLRRRTR